MKRQIVTENLTPSCYFKTSVLPPNRKALLQITERCNLHCAHCFVSASLSGRDISLETIQKVILPRLLECRVVSVTITGGEPFVHPELMRIVTLLRKTGLDVSICTNGTLIENSHLTKLSRIGNVRCNVSLDGFSAESHGKFRGSPYSFRKTVKAISALAKFGLLQGLLATPNAFAKTNEYAQICQFAIDNGAKYVLMNPLSSFGRGESSKDKLSMPYNMMQEISTITAPYIDKIEIVKIRFPNDRKLPLSRCEAGNIIYVFADGAVAFCPYMVFATTNSNSLYAKNDFIVGNALLDVDIADKLDAFSLDSFLVSENLTCSTCRHSPVCGRGCHAAVIAAGKKLGDIDDAVCPLAN